MEGLSTGQLLKMEDLKTFPIPEATPTYQPVSHYDLASSLTTIGQDILTDYVLMGENYGLARNGNQLFAVLNFKKDNSEMALSFGFRNSYDKSMSIGFCCGASVFVCDNLMFQGDIAVMRKHTKNVLTNLEDLAITTLYRAQYTFGKLVKDTQLMRDVELTNEEAYEKIGLLWGKRFYPIVN